MTYWAGVSIYNGAFEIWRLIREADGLGVRGERANFTMR